MKTVWTKENKPSVFERTDTVYCSVPLERFDDRQIMSSQISWLSQNMPDGCFLAGSWFESLYRGDQIKDFDMFFRDESSVNAFIELLRDQHDDDQDEENDWLLQYEIPDDELLESLLNDEKTTAITIKNKNAPAIQIIRTRFYDSISDVIDSFDFTVCQFGLSNSDVCFNPVSMLDLVRKRLVLHRMTFPSSTIRRLIKYANKGYYACGGSLIDMVEKIKESKPEDDEVLYID